MDQNSKKLIDSLNDMRLTVDENDEKIWACKASSKCYKEATENLRNKNRLVKEEIERIDKEIKEIEPEIKILEALYKTDYDMFKVNFKAISQLLSYNSLLKEKVDSLKHENANVLEDYKQHYNSVKSDLVEASITYKIQREKEVELKKVKFKVMMLQAKIKQRKQINEQKKEIKQKMFYNFWIKFAKAWLDTKKYNENVQKLQEVAAKEKELMQKYFESCERLKKTQRLATSRKKELHFSNEDKGSANNFKSFKISSLEALENPYYLLRNELPTKNDVFKKPESVSAPGFRKQQISQNPCSALKFALEHGNEAISPKEPIASNGMLSKDAVPQKPRASTTPSAKPEFNPSHSKVRILENSLLTRAPLTEKNKIDRTKIIENKLQQAANNFNKKLQKFRSNKSQGRLNQSLNMSLNVPSPFPVADSRTVTERVASGATQQLENLNILSQESCQTSDNLKENLEPSQKATESIVQSPKSSQQLSQTHVQGQLLNEPNRSENLNEPIRADEVKEEHKHVIQKKISEMKFLPQATKTRSDQIRQKFSETKNMANTNFTAIPRNFPGNRESCNGFKNSQNKEIFSPQASATGAQNQNQNQMGIMPSSISNKNRVRFSMDVDDVQVKNTDTPNESVMEFGETQYNFGNITALSTTGQDGGYASPEYTSNFSFNNENVGFSFGAPAPSLFSFGQTSQANNEFVFKF